MLSASEFLSAVLPRSGRYCLFLGKTKRHIFFSTIPELADAAVRQSNAGETVYHACSTFNADSRKAAHVAFTRSLYLDLDCGAGKAYATQGDALAALGGFIQTLGLPMPMVASSGYGVHVYWPFDRDLPPAEWTPLANALKAACFAQGLKADPTVTGDLSRILRPVETHNYKDPTSPRPVTCGAIAGPYDPGMLAQVLTPRRAQPPGVGLAGISDALQPVDSRPAYAVRIADQCAQLQMMRDTRGQMSEPEWHSCVGVLAFCADGETFVHEWSKGDPRYSQAETQSKFSRTKQLTGPTTCSHFQSLNSHCLGCPHQGHLASPVQLGRIDVAPPPPVKVDSPEKLPTLWHPFIWGRDGQLMWQQEGNEGQLIVHIISEFPIVVARVARGEVHGEKFSVALRSRTPNDGWEEHEIPGAALMANTIGSTMSERGLIITDAAMFRKYIGEAITNWRKQEKAAVQYEQFGWKHERKAFLLGTRLYREDGAVNEIQGSFEVRKRGVHLRPGGARKAGTLEGWQKYATRMCAPGLEPHTFAMMCGFAAPLISFLTDDEGGGIVSLVSHETGKGKTTSIDAAVSIWGDIEGCDVAHIDTKVSRGLIMGVLGNLPVRADELVQRDPEALKEIVQVFTGGRDKNRATQGGELQHNLASWRTIMLTSSNKSLVEAIHMAKGSPAMGARILEFDLSHIDKSRFDVSETKRGLHQNVGFAGDIYMRALLHPANRAFIEDALFKQEELLIQRYGFTVDDRYRVRVLSSVYVGGNLAKVLGLVNVNMDRIVTFACEEIRSQKQDGRFKARSAVELLAQWLSRNQKNVLVVPYRYTTNNRHMRPMRPFIGDLMARHETDTNRILVSEAALRHFISDEDYSYRAFVDELRRHKVVTNRLPIATLGAGVDELRTGPVKVLEIDGDHPDLRPIVEPEADHSNVVQLRR